MNAPSLRSVYQDPASGTYYVLVRPPSTAAPVPTPHLSYLLRPLPDDETAKILTGPGAIVGQLVRLPPPGVAFHDAGDPRVTFHLGAPYPALHLAELITHGGHYYVLELHGGHLVPDDKTLAAKGYQPSEAVAIADADFALIPAAPKYVPVWTAAPIVLRGSRSPDTYLYWPIHIPDKGVPKKKLLIGVQTIWYYSKLYSYYGTVVQEELDQIPIDPSGHEEVWVAKQLTVVNVECLNQAHRVVGNNSSLTSDQVTVRASFDVPAAEPPTEASYNLKLLRTDMNTSSAPISGDSLIFYGMVTLGIQINDDNIYLDTGAPRNGFLYSENAEIFFDTSLFNAGDHYVNFTAQTTGFVGHWSVDYRLTIRVDGYLQSGQPVTLTDDQLIGNIYRIKHFFVLMMENRSFDHLLAANSNLKLSSRPPLQNGNLPLSSGQFTQPYAPLLDERDALQDHDASHSIDETFAQIWGHHRVVDMDQRGFSGDPTAAVLDAQGRPNPSPSGPGTMDPRNFLDSFSSRSWDDDDLPRSLDAVIGCYAAGAPYHQAYAINELAENFTLFEAWHASVPGPTSPNRFFLHCGTSGGMAYQPESLGAASASTVDYVTGDGFNFLKGSIFDRLNAKGIPWRIYHTGGAQVWDIQGLSPFADLPDEAPLLYPFMNDILRGIMTLTAGSSTLASDLAFLGTIVNFVIEVLALHGLATGLFGIIELIAEVIEIVSRLSAYKGTADFTAAGGMQRDFGTHFREDVNAPLYVPFYTFIEPDGSGGQQNDGHPSGGPELRSETYIASVYESLRASPMWGNGDCALLIVYDEHGGIFDHMPPPLDPQKYPTHDDTYRNKIYGDWTGERYSATFDFSMLGIRVPAILISPYTYKDANTGQERVVGDVFEHSSVVRTLQDRIGDTDYLSDRVKNVDNLFAAFGQHPLDPALLQAAPRNLRINVPPAGPTVDTTRLLERKPIPPRAARSTQYRLDRAAEIRYRCDLASDPTILRGYVAAARSQATRDARVASLQSALAQHLANYRAERNKLSTMAEANAYLAAADAALEDYRKRVDALRGKLLDEWALLPPKQKYAKLRDMVKQIQSSLVK